MTTWSNEDKEIADKAAIALNRLQGKVDAASLRELEQIRNAVANTRTDEHERAAAWLALCALVDCANTKPQDPSMPGLWSNAIKMTNGWRGTMR